MLTDIEGVRVGHWTDAEARTGCTVVLLPEGTVASGEVRGGAPATREFALLEPGRLVDQLHAVVLAGGSAFGLAAADGVVRWLERQGDGFVTEAGPVPIVVGMALFDLMVGDATVRPGPDEGAEAAAAATDGPVETGAVGAGTGATVGKWRGRDQARPAGLGAAVETDGDLVVAALFAVNAFGDVGGGAAPAPSGTFRPLDHAFGNTTIGVVVTNARLDKLECNLVAQGAHDGLARAVVPAHTRVDGDAVVVAATGGLAAEASVDAVRHLAVRATERAVLDAVPDATG